MIVRFIVRLLFGNIWKLKRLCRKDEDNFKLKFYRFVYNWYQFEHGSAILYKSTFVETPILPRGNKQIIIDENVVIGKKCVIFQQVTIQSKYNQDGSPKIGDNCILYPGAKIVGDITIGNNVTVEANAVVTFDVEDYSIISVASQSISKRTK